MLSPVSILPGTCSSANCGAQRLTDAVVWRTETNAAIDRHLSCLLPFLPVRTPFPLSPLPIYQWEPIQQRVSTPAGAIVIFLCHTHTEAQRWRGEVNDEATFSETMKRFILLCWYLGCGWMLKTFPTGLQRAAQLLSGYSTGSPVGCGRAAASSG